VVFDVGETLVDESRMWAEQAHAAGVTPFTLMGLIGALIERDEPHHAVWDILGVARPTVGTEIRSSDLYPDAFDCLRAAKGVGFKVGIAGNQPSAASKCLRSLGFDADFVASSMEWGVAKPSVGFFSRIVGVSRVAPGEVLPAAISDCELLCCAGGRGGNSIVNARTVLGQTYMSARLAN